MRTTSSGDPLFITCLLKPGAYFCNTPKYSYICSPSKVPRRRLPARDQKGTPVRIRDYSRSCKLRREAAHSYGHCPFGTGRRAAGASQKTCLAGHDARLRDTGRRRYTNLHRIQTRRSSAAQRSCGDAADPGTYAVRPAPAHAPQSGWRHTQRAPLPTTTARQTTMPPLRACPGQEEGLTNLRRRRRDRRAAAGSDRRK